MTDVFTSFKPAWHIDRIATLRVKKDIVPTHVQLIISDLCNQNCVPAGTEIECESGTRKIEDISVGDQVFGPDGELATVAEIGNRLADDLYEICIDGKTLRATGEHPILTQEGWKEVRELSARRDSAVVRVRLRQSCEMESALQTLGKASISAREGAEADTLFAQDEAITQREKLSIGSTLQMWLREAGSSASAWCRELLGGFSSRASVNWSEGLAFQGVKGQGVGSYETRQSNVQSRDGCEDVAYFKRYALPKVSGGCKENSRGRPRTNAFGCEPDEKPRHPQGGDDQNAFATDEQERRAFQGVGRGEENPPSAYGRREHMDRPEKPRFSDHRSEESRRSDAKRMLYRAACETGAIGIRGDDDIALPQQGMGVSGGVQEVSPKPHTGGACRSDQRLYIAGIELERGLELRRIDSIRRIDGEFRVYNFHCPPIESYIADGVVVHNCSFCAYRMDGGFSTENFADEQGNRNPTRWIPTDKAKEILTDCAILGVGAIEFTGGGEPTAHPDHLEIIEWAQNLGLQTGLVTNAVKMVDHPVYHNLDWLRISLDSGTEETYRTVRESKAWPKVMDNLRLAATFKHPYTGVGFVVTRDNYRELPQACQIAKDAGIPYVRVSAMFSNNGADYYEGLFSDIRHARLEAKKIEDENFKVVDLFTDRVDDLDQGRPDYSFCGEQQFVLYIGGDLKVYTCCTNAYTTHGEIGDLKDKRFADWMAEHNRYGFDARSCHHCQFNDKNRLINYLLEDAPEHVDFV